jgi:hypothetical protein
MRKMETGRPLEVERGACIVHTSYKQDGEELNWQDTVQRLGRYEDSGPYVSEGNTYAIGSIVAAVVATPSIIVGSAGMREQIDMDEGLATGLLVGGIVVGVGGLVMCVVSDGKYATAGDVYNERVTRTERRQSDERAYEVPEE